MKLISSIIMAISLFTIFTTSLSSAENNDIILSDLINGIISSEKDENLKNSLIEIASSAQDTYSDLYTKLSSGEKIRIFIDPAHGKVRNNDTMEWQGALTWRKSTTGIPEEIYSIPLARKFYKLASENPFIEIVSFPDYMDMLTGKSESYNDVSFDDSVDEAWKTGSFLIISEHLNNISPISKADGFVNIPGLHITCNQWRTPFLSYVSGVYRGYFTYYNLFDVTGSSRIIGEEFRNNMTRKGHTPNSWDNGVVGDDRFSLYVNFPVSVIFESGFISNPVEEQLLKEDTFQNDIVVSQYNAILSSIRTTFGVDISGNKPEKIAVQNEKVTDNIILTRFFTFYVQNGEFNKSLALLKDIEVNCSHNSLGTISSYEKMRSRIKTVAGYISNAETLLKRKRYSKALIQYSKAIQTMNYHPLFNDIREKLYDKYNSCAKYTGTRPIRYSYRIPSYDVFPPELTSYRSKIENHSVYTPYIITISDHQNLEEAVDLSIAPNQDIKPKILSSLSNSTTRIRSYQKVYSAKRKKYVYKKIWIQDKVVFTPGMYIVSFTKSFTLRSIRRVPSVIFDPNKYQNQQFFKNSCLAEKTKVKSL